jgi:hypothetical protein
MEVIQERNCKQTRNILNDVMKIIYQNISAIAKSHLEKTYSSNVYVTKENNFKVNE